MRVEDTLLFPKKTIFAAGKKHYDKRLRISQPHQTAEQQEYVIERITELCVQNYSK